MSKVSRKPGSLATAAKPGITLIDPTGVIPKDAFAQGLLQLASDAAAGNISPGACNAAIGAIRAALKYTELGLKYGSMARKAKTAA